jgi:hypothetical protein
MLGPMAAEGLYRKRNGWGDQHSVRVKYDGALELEVPESFYREEGWQPPVDDLPWHGESAKAAEADAVAAPAGAEDTGQTKEDR